MESINEQDASLVTSRMSNNTLVHFPGDASMIGTLQNVSLDECRGFYYMGTLVCQKTLPHTVFQSLKRLCYKAVQAGFFYITSPFILSHLEFSREPPLIKK